jgi:hypothetical protein
MSEPATPRPSTPAPPKTQPDAGHMPITEELDRAKWTLPPVTIILIGIVIIGAIAGIIAFATRPQPVGQAAIREAYAVETTSGVLTTIQFTLANGTDKPVFVKNIAATLSTGGQQFTDDTAASASDYERYEQAYPDMRQHVSKALGPETQIKPGQEASGTAIFSFNVNKQQFDSRTGLKLTVTYFDDPHPLVVEEIRGGQK